MPDLEVITENIRAAAGAAHEVAEALRPIDVTAVGEAAEAIPGARAANLFEQLEKHLVANLTRVASGFAGIADAMHDAAHLYERNEEAAAEAMAVPYAPEPGI